MAVPRQWYGPVTSNANVPVGWINDLGDRTLPGYVRESIQNNQDLQALAATVERAQANARRAGALLYPQLDFNAGFSEVNQFAQSNAQQRAGISSQTTTLGPSMTLGWEVDLWGRLLNAKRSAYESASAAAADLWFARQSLAANVAQAYFFAIQAREQVVLAEEFVENFAQTYGVVKARFDAGAVTMQDLATSEADLSSSKQNAEAARLAYRESLRTLEILLGRYPAGTIAVGSTLPNPSRAIPSGLPAELLGRRYDVIGAERQVASAFRELQSRRAARLPRISLTSGVGTASNSLKSLVDPANAAFSFGLNLLQPVFDAGLLRSDEDIAKAIEKQTIANYGSTVLNAFSEVENSLDALVSLNIQVANLADASKNYGIARQIAETRYKEGATDLTSVLVVQRQELQSRTLLISSKNQRLAERISLYLALGGDFDYVPALDESVHQLKAEEQVQRELGQTVGPGAR